MPTNLFKQGVAAVGIYSLGPGLTTVTVNQISKNGAAPASPVNGTVTALVGTLYAVAWDAADLDTLGSLGVDFAAVVGTATDQVDQVQVNPDAGALIPTGSLPSATAGANGGLLINGTNAGPLTINGGTTLANSTGTALTIQSTAAGGIACYLNGAGGGASYGLLVQGQGTVAAARIVNTASGPGLKIDTAAGDALVLAPIAGHGLNIAANGTSKHGLFVTGGTAGTSDGVKYVAGTGGVALRADTASFITTALTESYAADGAAATLAQLLYQIYSAVQQVSITGTSLTCYQLDGTTPWATITLDSATSPTSRVRTA